MPRSEVDSDTFDSSIDSEWDNGWADWDAISHVAGGHIEVSGTSNNCAMRRNTGTYDGDQYSITVVNVFSQGTGVLSTVGPQTRCASGASDESCYIAQVHSTNSVSITFGYELREFDSSYTGTTLATAGSPLSSMSAGDTIVLESNGSDHEMFTDEGSGEVSRVTATDSTLTSGRPGIFMFTTDIPSARFTEWSGGDIVPVPDFFGVETVSQFFPQEVVNY